MSSWQVMKILYLKWRSYHQLVADHQGFLQINPFPPLPQVSRFTAIFYSIKRGLITKDLKYQSIFRVPLLKPCNSSITSFEKLIALFTKPPSTDLIHGLRDFQELSQAKSWNGQELWTYFELDSEEATHCHLICCVYIKGHVEMVDTKDQNNAIVYCVCYVVCQHCWYLCLWLLHTTVYRVMRCENSTLLCIQWPQILYIYVNTVDIRHKYF